jgi:selenocysteine lyase/cysteine desulfurase
VIADALATGVDLVIGSAYKFFGPHVGVFYARRELLEQWRPYQIGHAAHGHPAARFEPGTPPFESLAGLTAALDYIHTLGRQPIQEQEQALARRFLDGLPERWQLHGLPHIEGRTATFALTLPGTDPSPGHRPWSGSLRAWGAHPVRTRPLWFAHEGSCAQPVRSARHGPHRRGGHALDGGP